MVEKKGSRKARLRATTKPRTFSRGAAFSFTVISCRSKQFNIAFCVSTLVRMHNVELAKVVKQREATTHNATSTAEKRCQPRKTACQEEKE